MRRTQPTAAEGNRSPPANFSYRKNFRWKRILPQLEFELWIAAAPVRHVARGNPFVPRRQILQLTSLRGLAAVWVLAHNDMELRAATGVDAVTQLLARGYLAVDFFFVLSGFVIARVYAERLDSISLRGYLDFLGKRIARIVPLLWFLLACRVGMEVVRLIRHPATAGPPPFTGHYSWQSLMASLSMTQGWGGFSEPTWIFPAWSVSCEWAAYLLAPLTLVWLLARRRTRLGGGMVGAICLFVVTVGSLALAGGRLEVPLRFGLLRCLPEFCLGVLAWRLFASWEASLTDRAGRWLDMAAAALAALLLGSAHFGLTDLMTPPTVVLLLPVLSLARGPFTRALSWRGLVYLGEISFAVYLCQMLVMSLWRMADPWGLSQAHGIGAEFAFALRLVLCLATAAALYHGIEKPARAFCRTWLSRWRGEDKLPARAVIVFQPELDPLRPDRQAA